MAAGDPESKAVALRDEPLAEEPGAVITVSGRRSVARMYQSDEGNAPFSPVQLARIDEALTLASREAGLDFSIYIGELGQDSRAGAERLHDTMGSAEAVLIAVSPGERVVEVVTGGSAQRRIAERGTKLAVMSMVAFFKEGDLVGGLLSGLRMLSDQAGSVSAHHG